MRFSSFPADEEPRFVSRIPTARFRANNQSRESWREKEDSFFRDEYTCPCLSYDANYNQTARIRANRRDQWSNDDDQIDHLTEQKDQEIESIVRSPRKERKLGGDLRDTFKNKQTNKNPTTFLLHPG